MPKDKDETLNETDKRTLAWFGLAFLIAITICGSFYYGGWTACKLGEGHYYKFACVNLKEVPVYVQEKAYIPVEVPKDRYAQSVYNITQND